MDRRKFVVRAVSMSAALPLACDSQPVAPTHLGPSESRDTTGARHDVRDSGATGDGMHDDTDAFARGIDVLPPEGGTLNVPAGVYLIDPLRSIVLRDGVTLALHPQAVLKAIPVAAARFEYYAVVRAMGAQNIRIAGGSIIGERAGHLGTVGECGMGVWIGGCKSVVIEDVYTCDCWGDGIYIAAFHDNTGTESRDVTVRRCRSVNNRRQGLSITGCIGARVTDSEFSDTNGTAPQSGIDLEPNNPLLVVRDVQIVRCRAVRNVGDGMMLVDGVKDVILEQNVMSQNGHEGFFVRDSARFFVNDNTIELNGANGIKLERARNAEITANVIASNACADPDWFDNISINDGSSENLVGDNDFTAVNPGRTTAPRFDIWIASEDCVGNHLLGNVVRDGQERGGIVDNGTGTEIVPPRPDPAVRRTRRRYTPIAKRRNTGRLTPQAGGR